MKRLWSIVLCCLLAVSVVGITLTALNAGATTAREAPPEQDRAPAIQSAWQQVNENGFGNAENYAMAALEVFDGALYAGTWNNAGQGQLWRAADGQTWSQVTTTWSPSNTGSVDFLTKVSDQLYVGLGNELWRTDGLTWQAVVTDGFGDVRNLNLENLVVFSDTLYVTTNNISGTHQFWRSPSGDAGTWTQVANLGAQGAVEVFSETLYIGVGGASGAELWRSADGLAWSPVFTNGLSAGNTHVAASAVFNSELYLGMRNTTTGGQLWRSPNGLDWTPVFTDGLGNPANGRLYGLEATSDALYAVFSNFNTGAEVWKMSVAGTWSVSAQNGFGEGAANNYADYFDKGAAVFDDRLYIGTFNNAGGEIWRLALHPLQLTGTAPTTSPNDRDTLITITGQNFEPDTTVRLGDTPLQAVTWVSPTRLTANVPWGLPPAAYTLTVTRPDGERADFPNAFIVTPGINVWTHGGPYGGVIGSLTLNPVTPTTLYAAASGSGVFVSEDGAAQWRPSLITPGPERVAIDPHNPQLMYTGSANRCLRSLDGGRTWDESCTPYIPPGSGYAFRYRPVVHPAVGGRVFLGLSVPDGPATAGRLYRSSDGGNSWLDLTAQLPQVDTNITAIAFDPANTARVILGTRDGYIYVSANNGVTWTQVARPDAHIEALTVNPFGAHEVWAVTNGTDWGATRLWRSVDVALTQWEQNALGEWVQAVTFHPTISGTLWAAKEGGFVSHDGGVTWSPVGAGLSDVLDFAVDPHQPATLYAGTLRGVFKSTDGGATWAENDTGLAGVLPNLGLAVSPANADEVYTASTGRVFRSFNGGQSWEELSPPVVGGARPHMRLLAVDPTQPNRVYLGDSAAFLVHLSEDWGDAWLTASLPEPWPGAWGGIWCVAPHPTISGRILAGAGLYDNPAGYGGAFYLSQNHGESWALLNTVPISGVAAITYDPVDPQVVYAGTEGGGILKSTNSGLTWQVLTTWTGGSNVQSVAIHPTNRRIFVSTVSVEGQGIYTSADGGLTWTRLTNQPTTGPVWELLYSRDTTPILYAGGMEAGLNYSTDEGRSWLRVPGMPGSANVSSLASTVSNGRVVLYVGTSGGAVTSAAIRGQAWNAEPTVLGSGVYRHTRRLANQRVYLPLVQRP